MDPSYRHAAIITNLDRNHVKRVCRQVASCFYTPTRSLRYYKQNPKAKIFDRKQTSSQGSLIFAAWSGVIKLLLDITKTARRPASRPGRPGRPAGRVGDPLGWPRLFLLVCFFLFLFFCFSFVCVFVAWGLLLVVDFCVSIIVCLVLCLFCCVFTKQNKKTYKKTNQQTNKWPPKMTPNERTQEDLAQIGQKPTLEQIWIKWSSYCYSLIIVDSHW